MTMKRFTTKTVLQRIKIMTMKMIKMTRMKSKMKTDNLLKIMEMAIKMQDYEERINWDPI